MIGHYSPLRTEGCSVLRRPLLSFSLYLASRGQALFPDLPDTPRGEKGLVSEMSRGVPLSWAWVLRCRHMTDYIAVDSLR